MRPYGAMVVVVDVGGADCDVMGLAKRQTNIFNGKRFRNSIFRGLGCVPLNATHSKILDDIRSGMHGTLG